MKQPPSRGNVLATAIGWIALLLYILACSPSWSPDGTKLLFPYYDPHRDQAGVAVLDRTTGGIRSVFTRPNPSSDDAILPVQWSEDGAHAILWIKKRELLFLPIDSREPARTLELPDEVELNGLTTPQRGGSLYFTGDAVVKVDVTTGETTTREVDETPFLFAAPRGIWYFARIRDRVRRDDGNTVLELNGYEFGRVEEDDLTLEPLFRIEKDELERHEIEELAFVAFEPNGRRLAVIGFSERGTRIVLCNETGIERVLVPQFSAERFWLGSIAWSPTQDVIYAAALVPTFGKDETQLFVAELALNNSPPRLVPLGTIGETLSEDDCWVLTLALSGDGTTIAASTAHNDEEDSLPDSERAVFLVELDDPERPVTKIPLSSWMH